MNRTASPLVAVLGGGQLARMLALAGMPLGIRLRVLDRATDASAGQVCEHLAAPLDDPDALRRLADGATCVTFESENVPLDAISRLRSLHVPVRPGRRSLEVCANRLFEKRFVRAHTIPVARFAPASSAAQLADVVRGFAGPVVVKTCTSGYDGLGQRRLEPGDDVRDAWESLGRVPLIVEELVPFRRELSLVSVRSTTGATAHYPLVENRHVDGILRLTRAPAADVPLALQRLAEQWASRLMDTLGHVGVFTIEFFETAPGRLLVNELAPRVHNSGHWTIEGAATSQFENHLRAILGRPLGSTTPRGHARMINLIGALPDLRTYATEPAARVHTYDKTPRPGRKLGHITLTDRDEAAVEARADRLLERLDAASSTLTHKTEDSAVKIQPAGLSRRSVLHALAGGAAALAVGALPIRAAEPARARPRSPDEALQRLIEGNARFVGGRADGMRRSLDRVRETESGQSPFAAILGCADSRVPPEILFDQGLGDLFVVRVAGNVATPEEIASLEFGVAALGAQLVMVLGHSACGAVKAALEGGPAPGQITTLYQHFQPALAMAGGDVARAVELNVRHQRDVLRSASPVLRDAIDAGSLRVVGAVYDLGSGRVNMVAEGRA